MTTLYKKDSKGKTRIWKIKKNKNGYTVEHGLQDGQRQIEEYIVPHGNANRTKKEQIRLEVKGKTRKKLDNGYVKSLDDIDSSDTNALGFKMQMKAQPIKDGEEPNIEYNEFTFIQRKYNGHRCTIVKTKDKKVFAYSRGGKLITSIDHILQDIRIAPGQELDGELYIHGLSLQKISGKVRRQNYIAKDLKFIIFDQISDWPFMNRFEEIPKQRSKHIIIAETIPISCFNDARVLFHKFKKEGYEGAMLRHGTSGYECGKRSRSIYKIKKLDGIGYYDAEFKVVRIEESVEGWAILVCETENGRRFKVSAPGSHYEKTEVLKNKKKYIGKDVTVEFPEWTDSGRPSQPVAINWREKDE